jgi:hypothetical protein
MRVAAVMLLAILGSACKTSTPAAPSNDRGFIVPSPGNLSGIVTDAASGRPLSGVEVSLPQSWTYAGSPTVMSDDSGHYEIPHVTGGLTYWLVASLSGYMQPCAAAVDINGDTKVDMQLVATSSLLESNSGISAAVPGTRRVSGFLYRTTAAGKEVAPGAFVGFAPLGDIGLSPLDVSRTVADRSGYYSLCGLPTDRLIYLYVELGNGVGIGNFANAQVAAGKTDATIDVTLPQAR